MRIAFRFPAFFVLLICCLSTTITSAQMMYDTALYGKMQWREIGPFRGGRSIAVAGIPDEPYTYYFGATGGGIWKSEDGGNTWINVSDGQLKLGIVGAIEIAPSNPNVIYAGTGEACIRGNAMPGEGLYKSYDAGKTWSLIGFADAQTISKIRVHPKDENLVYAAVFGHVFGQNPERGLYRSKDGGKNWERILYKNDKTAAVDVEFDPANPRILYASLWEANRNPWSMTSGGPGSGLYKSVDGGDTWKELTEKEGLPKGVKGRIGIAPSPAKAGRVWALVEAEEGGLYRTDDWGKTWTKVNDDHRIRQRAWYFSHVVADPKNAECVYLLNVGMYKSMDGGRTLQGMNTMHSDNHDLWIDPNNPQRMIEGNDGGPNVTYNGGVAWTEEDVATAQFYHVTLDNDFPYNVYGAQQDNSTVRTASRTTGFGISQRDWFPVGGGESGYVTPDSEDPNIVYAGSYDGYLTRYNHHTGQEVNISPWPDNPMGSGAEGAKYRFQWTYPIVVSHFDHKTIYVTANNVFKSSDQGMSWSVISPDLTRNDTAKLHSSGGPITKDNTSVEYYCTIFAFGESPVDKNVLWTGSDDGLVHVTRNGGGAWSNVTPGDLPPWSMISIVEPSPFDAGTAYVAANRYKLDDFRPYLYKTTDFGKSWKKIVTGIPAKEFTHVIREDPNKKGLLFAGTERGVYVSFDDGDRWQPLQNNLPVTPVHDLAIQAREKDLVAATHGRSFWVLDNLTTLYQLADASQKSHYLFRPGPAYRMDGFSFDRPGLTRGKNPPNGVVVYYYSKHKPAPSDSLKLEFLDQSGSLIKTFVGKVKAENGQHEEGGGGGGNDQPTCPADSGVNRFVWDMHYPDATALPGGVMWSGSTDGPAAVPGNYSVRLRIGKESWTQPFAIVKDPRETTTQADFQEQFDFLIKIRDKVSEAHETVIGIRDIRKQTNDLVERAEKLPSHDSLKNVAARMNKALSAIEEELVQTKLKAEEDALNYPIRLNDKVATIASVVGSADSRPTKQAYDVYGELSAKVDAQLAKYRKIVAEDLVHFNALVHDLAVPAVILKPAKRPGQADAK